MVTKEDLLDRFNITVEQAEYIEEQAKGLEVDIEDVEIKTSGMSNSKGDVIYHVTYSNGTRHICYI